MQPIRSTEGASAVPPHLFELYVYQYCALDWDCTRPFFD